jgi:hypothetical protein
MEQVKCGIGFDTIIVQYNTVPDRKKKSIKKKCTYTMGNGLKNKFYIKFQKKKPNAMVRIPLIVQRSWV